MLHVDVAGREEGMDTREARALRNVCVVRRRKGAERRERGFVHLDCASTGLDVLLGGARKAANDRWVGSGSYGFGNVLHRSALVTPRR